MFISRNPSALLDIPRIRRKAYSKLWLAWGSSYAQQLPGTTESLLQSARGTVLEIGAGSGELLHLYSPEKTDKIYGVEPAEDLYPRLSSRASAAGFGNERYIILKCGAEAEELVPALDWHGLVKEGDLVEAFDTIVCVRVLCMVPDVEEAVGVLYRCLKPGGRLIVCEHGVNEWRVWGEGSFVARVIQAILMLWGWSVAMGDCHLDRRMGDILINAAKSGGGWTEKSLRTVDAWAVLPYTVGHLRK